MSIRICTNISFTSILRNVNLTKELIGYPGRSIRLNLPRGFKRCLSASATILQGRVENLDFYKQCPPAGEPVHVKPIATKNNKSKSLEDPYQTRVATSTPPRARPDPVVWGTQTQPGPMSTNDLASYNKNGFLQLRNLLNTSEITSLHDDLTTLQTSPSFLTNNPRRVTEPCSDTTTRSIFEIHKLSPTVKTLLQTSRMTRIARQILGSGVYVHQSRINFKPAFTGKGFYWHSDFETWHAEDGMSTPRAVSFSVNLVDNSHANGPLMVIPGSHRTFVGCVGATPEDHHLQSLREQEIGTPDERSLAAMAAQAGGVEVLTGSAGSAVLFDSNCMHGSSDNISPFGRCNLFIVFNSIENALGAPYYSKTRRPEYIAARDFTLV